MTPPLVTAASLSYLGNAAFGVAVASGAIDNRRIRWIHHTLYVVTCTLTTAAIVAGASQRRASGLALLPALGPLAALPYAGGGLRRHATVAGAAAPAYAIGLALILKGR